MPDAPNENTKQNIGSDPNGEKISNSQLFNVIVTLDNHTKEKYQLPTKTILELVIEEDLFNWPYKGYIIYNNRYEAIERNMNPNAWFFRMDARDEISIQIKTISDEPMNITYPPEVWEMDLNFVIYDTEDIPSANIATKMKKIYFWDKRYQMMMDKKIFWSTVTAQKTPNAAHATDDERSMLTGNAIKNLLTSPTAANYPDSIDEENWDVGATKVLYTSPSQNSIADDLQKLISSHLSESNNDMVIFKYNNRIDSKWQLIPLYKFFVNAGKNQPQKNEQGQIIEGTGAGKWQLEHFFFDDIESDEGNTSPFRAPYNDGLNFEVDIKMIEWNRIATYEFTDMSGIDNTKALVSKPVYSYGFVSGQFRMDYEQNEIEAIKADFKELYTDNLLPEKKATPIFTLNKTKKNQINVEPEFCFARKVDSDTKQNRLIKGRGKILYGGLFLNEFIRFRVIGSPHRTIGKFIGIDRMTTDERYNFDNKICGQWFVTNVKHVWNHNRYVNDICAVKVHMYDDNGVSEDVD